MSPIQCIAESPNPTDPAIIFIHGLNGHPRETWMSDPANEKTLWPKWLVDDYKCSVYLVSYDAKLSRWKDSAMPLPNQGDTILELLSSEPSLQNRPLILAGHSMGGLVIKTMIHHGLSKGVERYKQVVDHIRGVVFIGTPHKGSQLATLASHASVLLRTNTQVKNMKIDDAHLTSLNHQFLAYFQNPPAGRVAVLTFAESRGIFFGKKIFGWRFGKTITVVGPNSSEPHVPGEVAVSLPEDHVSISKTSGKDQPLYKSLIRFLNKDVDLTLPTLDAIPEPVRAVQGDLSNITSAGSSSTPPSSTTNNLKGGDGTAVVGVNHGSINISNTNVKKKHP